MSKLRTFADTPATVKLSVEKILQLYRNADILDSLEDAKEHIKSSIHNRDGEMLIARYRDDDGSPKALVGVANIMDGETSSVTFLEGKIYEAGNGIRIDDTLVEAVVDTERDEGYLNLGTDGLYVAGIDAELSKKANTSDVYSTQAVDILLQAKADKTELEDLESDIKNTYQEKLTAGTGISISNNVVSNTQTLSDLNGIGTVLASGISPLTLTAEQDGLTVSIVGQVDSYSKAEVDEKIAEAVSGEEIDLSGYLKKTEAESTYQEKLTAGTGISIVSNVVSNTMTLTSLGAIGSVTASGTSPLTLTASENGTTVTINGSVDAYTKAQTDEKIAEAISGGEIDLSEYLKKADAESTYQKLLVAGYGISIEGNTITVTLDNTPYIICLEGHDSVTDPRTDKFYLEPNETGQNMYTEWVYDEYSGWINVGTTSLGVDLSDYYTKEEVDKKITESGTFDPDQYYNKNDITSLLNGKIGSVVAIGDSPLTLSATIDGTVATITGSIDLSDYLTQQAASDTYAKQSNTYTMDQVDDLIAEAISGGEIDLSGYLKKTEAEGLYQTLLQYYHENVTSGHRDYTAGMVVDNLNSSNVYYANFVDENGLLLIGSSYNGLYLDSIRIGTAMGIQLSTQTSNNGISEVGTLSLLGNSLQFQNSTMLNPGTIALVTDPVSTFDNDAGYVTESSLSATLSNYVTQSTLGDYQARLHHYSETVSGEQYISNIGTYVTIDDSAYNGTATYMEVIGTLNVTNAITVNGNSVITSASISDYLQDYVTIESAGNTYQTKLNTWHGDSYNGETADNFTLLGRISTIGSITTLSYINNIGSISNMDMVTTMGTVTNLNYIGTLASVNYFSSLGNLHRVTGAIGTLDYDLNIVGDNLLLEANKATYNGREIATNDGTVTSVTSLTSVPTTYRVAVVTVSTDGTLSLNNNSLSVGREIHVIIHNTASTTITVTLPSSSPYVNTDGQTEILMDARGYAEVNFISDGSSIYVRAVS